MLKAMIIAALARCVPGWWQKGWGYQMLDVKGRPWGKELVTHVIFANNVWFIVETWSQMLHMLKIWRGIL